MSVDYVFKHSATVYNLSVLTHLIDVEAGLHWFLCLSSFVWFLLLYKV